MAYSDNYLNKSWFKRSIEKAKCKDYYTNQDKIFEQVKELVKSMDDRQLTGFMESRGKGGTS